MIGNFTMSYITLTIPQSIYKEADIKMFIARFPYIIVLTPDLAGPNDCSKARDAPNPLKKLSYYLFTSA